MRTSASRDRPGGARSGGLAAGGACRMGGGEGGGAAGARGSSAPIPTRPPRSTARPQRAPALPPSRGPWFLYTPALAPPLATHRRLRRVAGLRRKRRRLPPPSFAPRDARPRRRKTVP
eukprot:scaffold9730_cov63-Phaeocystis_antarctica.AAC.2